LRNCLYSNKHSYLCYSFQNENCSHSVSFKRVFTNVHFLKSGTTPAHQKLPERNRPTKNRQIHRGEGKPSTFEGPNGRRRNGRLRGGHRRRRRTSGTTLYTAGLLT
jgi:hypothetical protein